MKRSDIVRAFDEVKPTQEQTDRMLENILKSRNKSRFNWRSFVPAVAAALVVITVLAGFKALDTAGKLPVSLEGFVDTAKSFFTGENGKHSTLTTTVKTEGNQDSSTKTSGKTEKDTSDPAVQPTAAENEKVEKTFTLNYVTYKEVTEELAKGLPVEVAVKEENVGPAISTINEENKFFGGAEVYEYLPIKGSFFTVLKDKDGSYKLFMFEKTGKNDIKSYFDIFGITSAEDIAAVTVSEGEKTVAVEDIKTVFEELSKAESDIFEYEKAIKPYVKPTPAAEPETTEPQEEKTTVESAQVSEPAVPDSEDAEPDVAETVFKVVTLKIKTVSGLVYETAFYPQIEYVSTCKISNDFSELLKTVLSQ